MTARSEMEAIFARHMDAELAEDLDQTLATMTGNPHLVNVPTMVGGAGPDGVREFYANRLIGQFFSPDVEFTTVSRTCDDDRLVDELIISFTSTGTRQPSLSRSVCSTRTDSPSRDERPQRRC
jgi:carboxymethylenebutenolidase